MELRDASMAGLPVGYHRNVRSCHHPYISRHKTGEQSANHCSVKTNQQTAIDAF